tara:strand:+ start:41794 stop:42138 length:345 start_codon:yes stop_codon:yes gene_type:complete
MENCLFCKIINKQISADIVYSNGSILSFRDINPVAPTHVLIIPKFHISTLNDIRNNHSNILGEIMLAAKEVAAIEGIAKEGYRTIFNCNKNAGQTVFHIHLHLIGGRSLGWPPG